MTTTLIASNPVAFGSGFTSIVAINDLDQIIATTATGAAIWQSGQTSTLRALSGDTTVSVSGLNNQGQAVGASNSLTANHPVVWQGGTVQQIPALYSNGSAHAFAINTQGVIVGSARTSVNLDQAFEEQNGIATALANLPGGGTVVSGYVNSRALAINDSNEIVGFGISSGTTYHATLWQDGAVTDLGSLSSGNSEALGINNAGTIIGYSVDSSGVDEAVTWQNGVMTTLSHLQTGGHTLAYGINQSGVIVGRSDVYTIAGWIEHAVMWQNGAVVDLNKYLQAGSGWVLNYAIGINANGEVTGMGTYNGLSTPFILAVGDPGGPSVSAPAAIQNFAAAPHGSAFNVGDSAANLTANLDGLQSLAAAGKLLQIQANDAGTLTVTQAQYTRDAAALADLTGSASVHVTGVAASAVSTTVDRGHVTAVSVSDTSQLVQFYLPTLAVWANAITSINFTDAQPVLQLSAQQYSADSQLLSLIQGSYTLDLSGVTMANAASEAALPHIGFVGIVDTVANAEASLSVLKGLTVGYSLALSGSAASISSDLDSFEALGLPVTSLSFHVTDAGVPTLSVTAAQLSHDSYALTTMSGNFLLSIDASNPNLSIVGLSGHADVVVFPDAVSDYKITETAGPLVVTDTGTGRTSTDDLYVITELKFQDSAIFLAVAPSTTQVTTGNVAELYAAVLGRTPDAAGLAYYQQQYAGKSSSAMLQLAENFLNAPEYTSNAAHHYAQSAAGDAQFINDVYQNLLHRAPETGAVPYYQNIVSLFTQGLTPGTTAYANAALQGHAQVLVNFAASQEFLSNVQITAQHPADAQHWLMLQ